MYIFSLVLIVVLTLADQLIKLAVVRNIEVGEIIRVIHFGDTDIFNLTHITNKGAAWSMMEGKSWFLIGFPLVVVAAGLVYMFRKRKDSRLQNISLALLVAGGLGNLIDRIRLGEVVDYIRFEPINFPVFNFADICVVIGVIMLAVYFIFFDKSEKDKKKAAEAAEEPSAAETAADEPAEPETGESEVSEAVEEAEAGEASDE